MLSQNPRSFFRRFLPNIVLLLSLVGVQLWPYGQDLQSPRSQDALPPVTASQAVTQPSTQDLAPGLEKPLAVSQALFQPQAQSEPLASPAPWAPLTSGTGGLGNLLSDPAPAVPLSADDVRGLPADLVGKTELTVLRRADSATFDMGDGTYALVQDAQPMHYQDNQGNWQPINPAFVAVESGWINNTNSPKIGLSPRNSDAKVGVAEAGVGWEPQSVVAAVAGGQAATLATVVRESEAASSQLSQDGRSVRYTGNWSNPALQDQWRSGYGSVEYTMRLSSLPELLSERSRSAAGLGNPPTEALERLSGAVDSLELRVYLHLRPGTTVEVGGEPVSALDLPLETRDPLTFVSTGGDALWLQPPQAREQGAPSVHVTGSYRLAVTAEPTTMELSVCLPWDWLAAEERRFPVVVDPVFQMRSGTIVRAPVYSVDEPHTFLGYAGAGVGRFLDAQQRLLIRFETPTQPPETAIIAAYLVAVPTGGGFVKKVYFSQRVQVHGLEQWTNPYSDDEPIYTRSPQPVPPGAQLMRYGEGDPKDPDRGAIWDVTTLVQGWISDPNSNWGIILSTPNEFCEPDPNGCGGFFFGPEGWTDDELQQIEENSTPGDPSTLDTAHGGVRLIVYFTGPELDEGEVVGPHTSFANFGIPDSDDPYFHADHEYRLVAQAPPYHWQAAVARGLGETEGTFPPHQGAQVYSQHLQGSMPLELRIPALLDMVGLQAEPKEHLSYVLLNGRQAGGDQYNLRVKPQVGDDLPLDYDIRLIGEKESIEPTLGASVVRTYAGGFDSNDPLELWNIDFGGLPAGSNVRLGIEIYGSTLGDPSQGFEDLYDHARGFSAELFEGSSKHFLGFGSPHTVLASNAPEEGDIEYGSVELSSPIFSPDTSPGDYALALAYNGPGMHLWIYEPPPRLGGSSELPEHEVRPMAYSYRVRVTACPIGEFPTKSGTCQEVVCPNTNDHSNPDIYREHGGLGLWSDNGWNAPGPPAVSEAVDVAPMVGAADAAPSVAVVGGQISYSGSAEVTLNEDSLVLLVDCGTLSNPTSVVTADHYFHVYDGAMFTFIWGLFAPPIGAYQQKHLDPWRGEDRGDVSNEWFFVSPFAGEALGGGDLLRRVEGVQFSFEVSYSVDVGGYPSLDSTISRTDANTPPTVASLILTLSDNFSLDVTPAGGEKTNARYLENVRDSDATIRQPPELGGAVKPVQALMLGVGIKIPTEPAARGCGDESCLDLRALDDAPNLDPPRRNWQMPDVHTNVRAGTVMFRTQGRLQVYSVDHPAAVNSPESVSQEFSFDAFDASVSVGYEKCVPEDLYEVMVIRGETQLTMPNIGAVGAGFKLCESSLRSVHFEFFSPVGIPLANSGLFLTGMSGQVDILPEYTLINFGLNFQTGDGGHLFRGWGDVTIDTRGLFEFQGAGEILGLVDANGRLWVAWNPLDVGLDMSLVFELTDEVGLEGSVWAHMWEGQGWQHKYHWLPDNDDTHMSAQIAATFYINAGAAFSWWWIDIPPFDISIGVEVAFGQFCTNASCSSYEWGVKGKLVICGFDIGLYYGFDHGIDFILGSDDHVLIDQYGGGAGPSQAGESPDGVIVRAASPAVNGVATEILQVSADAEQLLVALGWEVGSPQLTLYDPDGVDVEGSPDYTVAVSQTAHSKLIGVQLHQPEPGDWHAEISGLAGTGEENYKFIYFANKGAPGTVGNRARFLTPGPGIEDGTGVYTITWEVPPSAPVSATISLYYTRYYMEGGQFWTFYGDVEDTPIVKNLPFGAGSYTWDTSGLQNYYYLDEDYSENLYGIRAVVDDGVNDFPAGSVYDPQDTCKTRSELPSARAFDPNRFPGLSTFSSVGKIVVTDTVAPQTPKSLELEGVDGAILARWDPSPEKDLAAYVVRWGVYRDLIPPGWRWYNEERVTAVLSPTLRLGGLESGRSYQAAIKAIDVNGNESKFSSIESATPTDASSDPVPLAPISLTVESQTPTYVHFAWSPAATGAAPDSYRLVHQWLVDLSTTGYTDTLGYVDTTVPSANVTGLRTGATYRVSVSAANSEGWRSASSNPITVTVTDGVDNDGDGLPDDWAGAYGVYGSTLDPDGDGVDNALELLLGTDPTAHDSDGDDFSDWEEQAEGTDPLDQTSFPAQLTQPRLTLEANRLVFRIKAGDPLPVVQPVEFRNSGGGVLTLHAETDSPWIQPSVEVPPGDVNEGVVLVAVDTSGLPRGFHSGVVRLNSAPGSACLIGAPRCIRVEAWVSAPWRLYLPLISKDWAG